MKNPSFKEIQSAPACQLNRTGTESSFGLLSHAVRNLPNRQLKALEDDLEFHAETGLVGTHMSWLLVLMQGEMAA